MTRPPGERIVLGDGRRAQLRSTGSSLIVTYGAGEGSQIFSVPVRSDLDLPFARNAVTEWSASLKPAAPLPPVLGLLERARELARWVARLDEIESEADELRRLIAGAMS